MTSPQEHYRKVFENFSLIGERFVYMAPPGGVPTTAPVIDPAESVPKELKPDEAQEPKPISAKDLVSKMDQTHQTLTAKYEETEGKTTEAETKALSGFKGKMDAIRLKYKGLAEEAKTDPAAEASKAVRDGAQALISKMTPHVEEGSVPTAEAAVATNTEATEVDVESPTFKKSREMLIKGILKASPGSLRELGKLMFPGQQEKIDKVTAQDIIKAPGFDKFITHLLKNIKPEEREMLAKGEMPKMTKENLKIIQNAFRHSADLPNLSGPDKAEMGLVGGLTLESTDGSEPRKFTEVFGEDSSIPELLSRKFKIEQGAGDNEGAVMINGKPVKSIADLKQFLPAEQFDKLTSSEGLTEENQTEENQEALEGSTKGQNEAMTKLHESIGNLEKIASLRASLDAGMELTGGIEGLGGNIGKLLQFFQILKAIKAAMDGSGDWDTVNDMLSDFSEGKDIGEEKDKSEKAYAKRFKEPPKPTLTQLLKAHMNTSGAEANALFGTDKQAPSGRYRGVAKPHIAQYLQSNLGLSSITSISKKETGFVELTGYRAKDGNPVTIELNLASDKPQGRILVHTTQEKTDKTTGEKTTEWGKPTGQGVPFKEVDLASLGEELGKASAVAKAPPTKPEKGPDKPEETTAEKLAKARTAIEGKLEKITNFKKLKKIVNRLVKTIDKGKWKDFNTIAGENPDFKKGGKKGRDAKMQVFRQYILSKVSDSNIGQLNDELGISGATEAAQEVPKVAGIKAGGEKFVGKNNVLKSIGATDYIHDVLDVTTVKSAIIQKKGWKGPVKVIVGEDTIGGEKVTTFVTAGKKRRLRIDNGDQILKTV